MVEARAGYPLWCPRPAQSPGFSGAAILTLALGIGNTTIFGVVTGAAAPLPYRDGGQLVVLHQQARAAHLDDLTFSVKEIQDYCDRNHTLTGIVEHHTMNFLLLGKDTAERVETAVVSANFFDVLGVKPVLGRTFVASDDRKRRPSGLDSQLQILAEPPERRPEHRGQGFPDEQPPAHGAGRAAADSAIPLRSRRLYADFAVSNPLQPGFRRRSYFADDDRVRTAQTGRWFAAGQISRSPPVRLKMRIPTSTPKYGYGLAVAPLQTELTERGRPAFLMLWPEPVSYY